MARNFSKDIPLESVAATCRAAGTVIIKSGKNKGKAKAITWKQCKLEQLQTGALAMGQAQAKLITKGSPLVTASLEEAVAAKCSNRQPYPDILPGAKLAKPCAPKYQNEEDKKAKMLPTIRDGHSELVFISPENASKIGAEPGPNIRLCYRLKAPGALVAVNNPADSSEVGKRYQACVKGDPKRAEKCAREFAGARQETVQVKTRAKSRAKKSGASLVEDPDQE